MPRSDRKTALFIQAEKLRMAKQIDQAIPAYRAVLEEDPEDVDVHKTLAGLYLMGGNRLQGLAEYMLLLGKLLKAGDLDRAEPLLDRVKNLDREEKFKDRIKSLEDGIQRTRDVMSTPAAKPATIKSLTDELPALIEDDDDDDAQIVMREVYEPVSDDDLRTSGEEATDLSRSSADLSSVLFQTLPPSVLNQVIRACQKRSYARGSIIFAEGSPSESLYIVGQGTVELRARRGEEAATVSVHKLGAGEFFGLIGFLTGDPREATALADDDCVAFEVLQTDAENLMADHPAFRKVVLDLYKERVIALFMATSRLLAGLPAPARSALCQSFEDVSADTGETIIHEGTEGNDLFFVKRGRVQVFTQQKGFVELAQLGKHEFFGEVSLFTNGARTASVVTVAPTELFRVPGDKLRQIAAAHPALRDTLKDVQLKRAMEAFRKLSGQA
ncbi:MAG: cyclic nucleotide-binding domain-containing protein [Acidobacteriota bacterium]